LLSILSNTIGQNNLGELYDDLKCDGQFMQVLAILMIETKQSLTLITFFKIFHEILLGPEAEKLLHLLMASLNSTFEKGFHSNTGFEEISSNILILT